MSHPGLLHPEPLSLQGCTVGPQETLSPTVSTEDTQTQFCLSLCGVSGSCGAQGFFEPSEHLWQVRGSILNSFAPPTILLGLLCPWTWGISSGSLQCCAATTPVPRNTNKTSCTPGRSSDPTKDRPKLACERPGVSSGGMGQFWPAAVLRALSAPVCAWDLSKEAILSSLPPKQYGPRSNNREGTQPCPSKENGIKDLLSMSQRLIEFCQENSLVAVNTFFQQHKRRLYKWTYQMVNTEIILIIFFAAKDRKALYSQQKVDWELTMVQIINSLLPNADVS